MWRIDSTIDALEDLISVYVKSAWIPDEEAKKAGIEKFCSEHLPKWAERMEKRLKENTSQLYFVGDSWTIADFSVGAAAFSMFENELFPNSAQFKAVIEKFPILTAYIAHAKEASKEYLAARKPSAW
jgi:glutathione S-transferase